VVERIAFCSKGIPRLINSLCDNALLTTYQAFEQSVSLDRIDKAARDLKLQIQTNSDTPTQSLAAEVPTEFSLGADQPNDGELWQTDFDPSPMDDEEVTMTRGGRPRARATGFFVFLAIIFITAAGLIYSGLDRDDTRVAQIAPQQTNVGEANAPDPIQDNPEQGHLIATTGDPISAVPTETLKSVRSDARVFVHTPKYQDGPVLKEVGKALQAAGYELPDTRIAAGKTGGDVRFFFPDDRREANRIKSLVEAELRKQGFPVSLQLLERDGRRFQHAAPGKIEVWLPPLANPS
jgi:hypothetical protein